MTFRVHNTQSTLSQEELNRLKAIGCEVVYGNWDKQPNPEEAVCQGILGVHAVVAANEPYSRKVFECADEVKIVARAGVGFDKVDLEAATDHGVWVTNVPGANREAVADFTIGMILCLLRNIHVMAQAMKECKWERFRGRELGSLVLGVAGTGAIGREVVKRARGFGAKVLATDIQPDDAFAAKHDFEYVGLDDLMAQSDIVSIHVPLNDDTRGLIDERRLGLMKSTAYLVNTARPAIVDKAALVEALQSGGIAGAAVDVHDPSPCLPDDPFLALDNVLVTPWTSANTHEADQRTLISTVDDIIAVLQGRPPRHPLNRI